MFKRSSYRRYKASNSFYRKIALVDEVKSVVTNMGGAGVATALATVFFPFAAPIVALFSTFRAVWRIMDDFKKKADKETLMKLLDEYSKFLDDLKPPEEASCPQELLKVYSDAKKYMYDCVIDLRDFTKKRLGKPGWFAANDLEEVKSKAQKYSMGIDNLFSSLKTEGNKLKESEDIEDPESLEKNMKALFLLLQSFKDMFLKLAETVAKK